MRSASVDMCHSTIRFRALLLRRKRCHIASATLNVAPRHSSPQPMLKMPAAKQKNLVFGGCDGDQGLADVPVDHDAVVANELLTRSIQHSHTGMQKCTLHFPKYFHIALKRWFLAKDVPADWVPLCWLADTLQVWGQGIF